MRVTYMGPSVGVDLLGPQEQTIRVERGQSIEVPDDYGAALVLQECWSGGDDDETAALSLAVSVPGLTPIAAAALVSAGYRDSAALAQATDDELDSVEHIGPATITTIREVIPENLPQDPDDEPA